MQSGVYVHPSSRTSVSALTRLTQLDLAQYAIFFKIFSKIKCEPPKQLLAFIFIRCLLHS